MSSEPDGVPRVEMAGTAVPTVEPGRFVFTSEEASAGQEPAWNGTIRASEADLAAADEAAEAAEPLPVAAGPNLMLAIVCWVASATSLFEAYHFYAHHLANTYAFAGYLTLGLGVLFFSLEAIFWSHPRRAWMSWIFAPATLLTLVGVIYLTLSHAPGRRI